MLSFLFILSVVILSAIILAFLFAMLVLIAGGKVEFKLRAPFFITVFLSTSYVIWYLYAR